MHQIWVASDLDCKHSAELVGLCKASDQGWLGSTYWPASSALCIITSQQHHESANGKGGRAKERHSREAPQYWHYSSGTVLVLAAGAGRGLALAELRAQVTAGGIYILEVF